MIQLYYTTSMFMVQDIGHCHQTAIVVLAVVIFLFDSLREKRSVPLTK